MQCTYKDNFFCMCVYLIFWKHLYVLYFLKLMVKRSSIRYFGHLLIQTMNCDTSLKVSGKHDEFIVTTFKCYCDNILKPWCKVFSHISCVIKVLDLACFSSNALIYLSLLMLSRKVSRELNQRIFVLLFVIWFFFISENKNLQSSHCRLLGV